LIKHRPLPLAGVGRDPFLSVAKQWGGEGLCSQHPHLSHRAFAKGFGGRAPVLLPLAGEDGNQSFSAAFKVMKAMGLKLRPEAA
jgi:hypothetical protein